VTSLTPLLRCPGCGGELSPAGEALACGGCGHRFGTSDGIPLLFWPNEWEAGQPDVTDVVKAFYEKTPFPDYDEFDSAAGLLAKARQGIFAKRLDDELPPGALVLECGCGTGQLTNFLSIANRSVLGTDICLNSLRLGQAFKQRNHLDGAHFLQMNLFRPCLEPGRFDLVISNGVLHHTADPARAFASIARLVRPGGYVLVGLYHRWGRLVTDLRRLAFRAAGERLAWLDPNLRAGGMRGRKRRAWFADQYQHPHESKHAIGEVLGWFERAGFDFVSSLPRTRLLAAPGRDGALFSREAPGSALERGLVELGMAFRGSREGGFFTVIGQKRV
jgi:SAM-dependent methyltransferase